MKLMMSGVTFSAATVTIAFVLAIFIIDNDKHPAGLKIFNGFGDGSEGHGLSFRIAGG